jgi:hypothetical protein
MVSFDQCVSLFEVSNYHGSDPVSLVSASKCTIPGTSMTIALDGAALDVSVNNRIDALGFNVVGARDGLTISNLPAGYEPGDIDVTGTFGTFEYFIYGSFSGVDPTDNLSFTLTRDAGFLSPLDLFELNEFGFLSGALGPFPGLVFATQMQEIEQPTAVPEPGSMLLLATGLAAAWRVRRRSN